MGLINSIVTFFGGGRSQNTPVPPPVEPRRIDPTDTAISITGADNQQMSVQTFNNKNITFQGNLDGFDYNKILRDKQANIQDLYSLSDYFVDADSIYRGTIRHVYVPFSMYPKWRITNVDEKTRQKFLEYYRSINLRKKMTSIFLQFYKFANVFVYVMPDGNIITLPVTKCRITNVSLNGEPLVQYDLSDEKESFTGFGSNDQRYFKDSDFKKQLLGYPEEVAKAMVRGDASAQLNPENLFVLQDTKEDWQRYAIPMIASFIPNLAKKALISQNEDALLNLGARGFVHVTYGSPSADHDLLPDRNQLRQTRNVFSQAMSGFPLAVTNNWTKAEFIQAETDFVHANDNYKEVNTALLSAGGISGIVVTGISEDGSTFASAQVSMQTAVARIEQTLDTFADMMTAINERVYEMVTKRKSGNRPVFKFMPLDLSGRKAMQEAGMTLYREGVLSTQRMLDNYGYDLDEEVAQRKREIEGGIDELMKNRDYRQDGHLEDKDNPDLPKNDGKETRGRPEMTDEERNSDPGNAQTGRQPKPSNPGGSMGDDG